MNCLEVPGQKASLFVDFASSDRKYYSYLKIMISSYKCTGVGQGKSECVSGLVKTRVWFTPRERVKRITISLKMKHTL